MSVVLARIIHDWRCNCSAFTLLAFVSTVRQKRTLVNKAG